MDDLIEKPNQEVEKYKRGTSLREVAKGVLTRFVPASVLSMFGTVLGISALGSPSASALIPLLTPLTGLVGVGFAATMLVLSRWLYPDAKVDGVRSALAGLLAPLLPLFFFYINALLGTGLTLQPWQGITIFILGGVLAAVGMFFPWLTETPADLREAPAEAIEVGSLEQLPGGAP